MKRCLELAEQGRAWVGPNPMVGCVIVKDGRIIGEGYHRRFGGPHAEIVALKHAGLKSRNAILYVNLEPCAHHGKTPPCADAILAAGIREVVTATGDPNPLVAGAGFRKLRAGGLKARTGVLRPEAEQLNEKFFWHMKKGVPFVGVKVAQTLDGRIADAFGKSRWITSLQARTYGHQLRSEYDAVLVGAGTVVRDNPELTVRHVKGRNPVRVVIDGRFRLDRHWEVFKVRHAPTVLLTSVQSLRRFGQKAAALERSGVQVYGIDSGSHLRVGAILRVLADLGISSVLVEGGSRTIREFVEEKCVQKIHCFIAGKILGSGLAGFSLGSRPLSRAVMLSGSYVRKIGEDFLLEGSFDKS